MKQAVCLVSLIALGVFSAGALAQPGAAAPAARGAVADADAIAAQQESAGGLREARGFDDSIAEALAPVPSGLTANQVAARAVASSDTIAVKQAELRAAAAQVDEAIASFLPQLTLSATYTRLSDLNNSLSGSGGLVGAQNAGGLFAEPCDRDGDGVTAPGELCVVDSGGANAGVFSLDIPTVLNNYALKARLGVPFSDYVLRLSQSISASRHNEKAAQLAEKAQRRRVVSDSRVAFYNWSRALGQVAVAEKSLERVRARLADAKVAFDLGTTTRADVLRLEALVAATQSAIVGAETFRDIAAAQLATMMGDGEADYQLGEAVTTPVSPLANASDLQSLLGEAYAHRQELQGLTEAHHSVKEGAEVVRRGQWPRLDGFAEYEYANPNQRQFPQAEKWTGTWLAGLALTWNVNDTFVARSQAARYDAQAVGLEAQRRALRRGVRLEVTQAFLEGRKASAALEAARRGAQASRAAYDVATELYRVGRATTTDVIEAESDLVSARLDLVNALIDLRVAKTQLAYAAGRDLAHLK